MSKAVYKFTLEDAIRQKISIRKGSVVLSCELQASKICLWALEDLDATFEPREVLALATGYKIDPKEIERFDFVGTVHDRNRGEVWHVFVEQAPRIITPKAMAEANREYLSNPESKRTLKEIGKARAGVVELNDKIQKLELERNELRTERDALQNDRNTAEGQVRKLLGQRHNQDREIQNFRDRVVELEAERLSLKSQVGPSLNSLREQVKRLESDNQKLKSDLEACLLDRAGK